MATAAPSSARSTKVRLDARLPVEFQGVSWAVRDVWRQSKKQCCVQAFGVTPSGESVFAEITGFRPCFYVRTPSAPADEAKLKTVLQKHGDVTTHAKVQRKDFYGFRNGQTSEFYRVTASSVAAFRQVPNKISDSLGDRAPLYQSNLDPLVQFLHARDLRPSGWIVLDCWDACHDVDTTCQIAVRTSADCVGPSASQDRIAPILVASFDIECTSSHGDFPLSKKGYSKTARELEQLYARWTRSPPYSTDPAAAGRLKSDLHEQLLAAFDHSAPGELSKVYPKEPPASLDELRTSTSMLMNDVYSKLKSLAAAKVRDVVVAEDDDDDEDDCDDPAAVTAPRATAPRATGTCPPLSKCSLSDVLGTFETVTLGETREKVDAWKGPMPALHGDAVVQIGLTMHRYPEIGVSHREIFCLGDCDPIPGAVVRCFKTEAGLLLGFRDAVLRLDPDVLAGFNTFGFDYAYLVRRAQELDVSWEFRKMGKLRDVVCEYREYSMGSSAMGDNVMRVLDVVGRANVDVMRVVRNDASHKLDSYKLDHVAETFLGEKKLDVPPNRIFELCRGSSADRRVVAEYCLQDCALCNGLIQVLQMLTNGVGMSNVCSVPLAWIMTRGQGVKIFSLVAKACAAQGFVIPTKRYASSSAEDATTYEGAIVLDPVEGIHVDHPVSVLDFSSLYPSCMISENLSHDTLVMDPAYDNVPGVEYVDVVVSAEKTCRFAASVRGVLPGILAELVSKRKETRARMPGAANDFDRAVLDGLQLAYKVTANSVYGQTGAATSPIVLKEIAASTTAAGRATLLRAKAFLETQCGARVLYGDTDSLFAVFPCERSGAAAINESIAAANAASRDIAALLKPPHKLAYQETLFPFVLLSRKRYAGNLYIDDDSSYTFYTMGSVMKRRDSVPIVKRVYKGVMDRILNQRDVRGSLDFVRAEVRGFRDRPLTDFVHTRALRSTYKNPDAIVHCVLANRMAERDEGTRPQVNDRVKYAFVKQSPEQVAEVLKKRGRKTMLQGDRVEHPDYIEAHGLELDYEHYLTNQLMSPLLQLYALALEDIMDEEQGREYKRCRTELDMNLAAAARDSDPDYCQRKRQELRERTVQKIVFDPLIAEMAPAGAAPKKRTDGTAVVAKKGARAPAGPVKKKAKKVSSSPVGNKKKKTQTQTTLDRYMSLASAKKAA